jgi:hypothetical protein
VVPFYDGVQHLTKIGDAFQYGGAHLCAGGVFPTNDGKAHLSAARLPAANAGGSFLVSARRGMQVNALILAETDPLTGAGRDAIFMADEDAVRLGLTNGARIALANDARRYEGRVFLADLVPGNLQIMWPEGNVIIRGVLVDEGRGARGYTALVRVESVAQPIA